MRLELLNLMDIQLSMDVILDTGVSTRVQCAGRHGGLPLRFTVNIIIPM